MKKFRGKAIMLLAVLAVLMALPISGTMAYLMVGTDELVNTFTPVQVDTVIRETVVKGSKSAIKVENKNDVKNIPVYVRVAVVGNWVNENGQIVAPWTAPATPASDWTKADDGFYYYNSVLQVGAETSPLFSNAITEADKPDGADHLVVTVVHQSIQSVGWPADVNSAQEAFAHAAQSVRTPADGQ